MRLISKWSKKIAALTEDLSSSGGSWRRLNVLSPETGYTPTDTRLADPYFDPPDKRVQVHIRIWLSLRESARDLGRLWRILHVLRKAKANDPHDESDHGDIDLSYVLARLIRVGLEAAWKEVGGRPRTDEEWSALEQRLCDEYGATKKLRGELRELTEKVKKSKEES